MPKPLNVDWSAVRVLAVAPGGSGKLSVKWGSARTRCVWQSGSYIDAHARARLGKHYSFGWDKTSSWLRRSKISSHFEHLAESSFSSGGSFSYSAVVIRTA